MADNPGSLRQFLKTVVRPAIYGRRAPLEVSAHHLHGEPIRAIEAVGQTVHAVRSGRPLGRHVGYHVVPVPGIDPGLMGRG